MKVFFWALFCTVHGVCRNGWVRYDDSCYLFIQAPKEPWTTAGAFCASAQGHLAEINTREENQFIRNHLLSLNLAKAKFWIGGEDYEQEGHWVWASNGNKIQQTFWAPHEPNSLGPEDCINLMEDLNYYWNDQECDERWSYICEKEDFLEVIG